MGDGRPIIIFATEPTIRKGYQNIRVRMRVKSSAKPEALRELATFSPVYDVVSNSVPVDLVVETY